MADLVQPSFSAGEIAPAAYARVDLAKYFNGLRACRNFVVMPEGGVQNRSGTVFVAESKDSTKRARLIPFQFSTEQAYILEFGDRYIRFYANGGPVMNGAVPYEIVTPYLADDILELKYTQSADVLTIVHKDYAPRDLSRLAETNWTLTVISFDPGIAAPTGLTATARAGGSGDTTPYSYRVTAVTSYADGSKESVASNTANVDSFDNRPGATLTWTTVSGADHYNVYKSRGSGIYGFIGQATTGAFTDANITPDAENTVPIGYNPFTGSDYPSVVGYHQQRLVFGASKKFPQRIWMSRTGDFKNFGYSDPNKDDDGLEFDLASREVNEIRHLVSLRDLLVLTSGAEWSITATSDSGITPTTFSAVPQSYVGSNQVIPAVYGNTALYVQARGGKLASLAYNYVSDGFQPRDVSVLSSHLMRGYSIEDQTFTLAPNGVLWMVRNDGALVGFTFLPEQEVFAWHRHDTDGEVESVASIPEGDEDSLYLIVRRTINGVQKRYVERMASRQLTKYESGDYVYDRSFFVDCGLSYDGRQATSAVLTGGTNWQYPNPLTLTAGAASFTAGMVGRTAILYGGGDGENIGDRLAVRITGYTSSTVVTVEPQTIVPESLRAIPATRWGLAATQVSGLGHLEGKTVSILGDGLVIPQETVQGGAITLDSACLVAHIGLPITAEFETLDIALPNDPAFLGNKKRISGVTVLCQESRGIFAGTTGGKMRKYELKQRSNENYGDPIRLLTGRATVDVSTVIDEQVRLVIRQTDPLPLTVLGVMPNVQAGG